MEPRCRIVNGPIDLEETMAAVAGPDRGAIAAFAGVVRDHHGGRRVVAIDYHAYAAMAEAVLAEIAAEAGRRFPGVHVAIVHRVGRLEVGETSVAVAVAAGHRREALAACAFVIDAVKARAPIWKKEHGEGGATWIEGPDPAPEEGPRRPPGGGS